MPGGRGLCGKIYSKTASKDDAGAKPYDVYGDLYQEIFKTGG